MSKKITLSLYRFWERAIKPLKEKLDGVATGANNYTHPSYTARTGKPTANQTPAFGGTATVSQVTSDATGHVTGMTDRTIKIPDTAMTGATTSAAGAKGLVPAPAAGAANRYLRSDGTWQVPPDNNTTYSAATTSAAGLMSAADKGNLNTLVANRSNKFAPTSLSLPTSGWTNDTSETSIYKYYYDLTVSGVTASQIPHVNIDRASIQAANACGLCPVCETLAGKIRFRSTKAPASAIAGTYWLES